MLPETIIAAVLLLEEGSIDEIVAKLGAGELEQVIKLVGRSPRCYPPGTLDALKGRKQTLAPEPVASTSTNVASGRPAARIKPDAAPDDAGICRFFERRRQTNGRRGRRRRQDRRRRSWGR